MSRVVAAFLIAALLAGSVPLPLLAQTATTTDSGASTDTTDTGRGDPEARINERNAEPTPPEEVIATSSTPVVVLPETATSTATTTESTGQTATTTAPVATTTPAAVSTSTPQTGGPMLAPTSTPSGTVAEAPTASSTSSTNSGTVAPHESGADNTDFQDIINGAPPPETNDPRPVVDASATTTEALATDPQLMVATSTDGTGHKTGGTIFTGNASAFTTLKNTLNISKSNVDGLGHTNSTIITGDAENEATLVTKDNTRATTGENRAQGGDGLATVRTGRATASAEVFNLVNTNLFNSDGLTLFLNPHNGDGLDLRDNDLSYFFDGSAGASPTQFGCTILTCLNSSALSLLNRNTATVDNDVQVRAATGGNTASSTKNGGTDIETGNAYAAANVLNMVNTNFINSSYLMVSFNNFGNLNDDIVLPSADFFERLLAKGNSLPELNSSSYIVNNTNHEDFTGVTTASATTGGNTATTTGLGHGEVYTGNAYSSSNSYTAANQTRVGGSSVLMVFRVWGNWSGTIKGLPAGMTWRQTEYGIEILSTGGQNADTVGEYNSSAFLASSTNVAELNTNVLVSAETGNNVSQTEHATGTISTGDAYAAANVVNLVNTNIVNRNWVFGTFNIFGDWSGDISFGGHSPNVKVETAVEAPTPTLPDSEVTYRFAVKNRGVAPASNVLLTAAYDKNLLTFSRMNARGEEVPEGTRWNIGTLAPQESREITVIARLHVRDLPTGFFLTVPVQASATLAEHDESDADNTSSVSLQVAALGSPPDSGSGGSGRDRGGVETPPPPPPPSGGGGSGGGGAPPPTGGGGGGAPPPSSGGGGGGTPAPPSGGGGGGSPTPGNPTGNILGSPASPGPSGGGPGPSGGGGGGGGVSGDAIPSTPSPLITVRKTANISTTSLPAYIDYVVTVDNNTNAGPLFDGVLTDTLYDPAGKVMASRTWELQTVAPADFITLSYTVEFASTSKPGTYRNVARVSGIRNHSTHGDAMPPVQAVSTIELKDSGLVLGTSTVGVSAACEPIISTNLRPGNAKNPEVVRLQQFLNTEGARLPLTGVYGPLTTAAVRAFQQRYASDILWPLGLKQPTGSVYASTMRKINALACGVILSPAIQSAAVVSSPTRPASPKLPALVVPKPGGGAQKQGNWLKKLFSW